MSTKTYANNPTANLFELLQVDSDLPDQKTSKNTNTKTTQAKKPADAPFETPAEKGLRRKAAEREKAAAAAAEKQRKENEQQMAALMPEEGFQVQNTKTKKPHEEKRKALNRDQFETTPVTQTGEKQKQFRGPGNPKKFDGKGDGQKPYDKRPDADKRQNNTTTNPARPPRHEGYDKHSGAKTTNKPPPKRRGEGAGNWGSDGTHTVGGWNEQAALSAPATDGSVGWGDESEPKPEKSTQGWGDEGEKKSEKKDTEGEEKAERKKPDGPAWDDEGFGKMTLEEFQKTVAAKRAQDLEALKLGVKSAGREVETTVDLSKCSYRETTDEKEKKLAEERRKQIAEEKKKRGQQRAGEKNVDLTAFIDVRTRGGRGGGRGGRGGDRPRTEGAKPEGGDQQQSPESRPARGGRGGRGGGGGNRVPKNAFPDLPPVTKPAAQAPAPANPQSTK